MEKKLIISVLVIFLIDILFVSKGVAQSDISMGELLSRFKYLESLEADYIVDDDIVFDKIMRFKNHSLPEISDESNILDTLDGDTIDINKTMDHFSLKYHDGIDVPAFLVCRYSQEISYGVLKSVVMPNENIGFVSTRYENDTVMFCFPLNKFESESFSTKGHRLHILFFVNRKPKGRFVFLDNNLEFGMSLDQTNSTTEAKYLKDEELKGIKVYDSTLLSFLVNCFIKVNYTNVYPGDGIVTENSIYSLFIQPYILRSLEKN